MRTDLKVKSCDIEAWSPRQQKYFEVCSCSNLGDAQARRLNIKVRDAVQARAEEKIRLFGSNGKAQGWYEK